MPPLNRQLAWYARAQLAVGLVAAATVVGAYLVALRPADARLADLSHQAAAARGELAARGATTSPTTAGVVALADRLRHAPDLTDPREPELFVRDLTRLSEQTGLRRLTVRSDAVRHAGPLCELPVVLTFHGHPRDVRAFLGRVEQGPWLVRAKNVQIRAASDGDDVEARLAMKVYSARE